MRNPAQKSYPICIFLLNLYAPANDVITDDSQMQILTLTRIKCLQ